MKFIGIIPARYASVRFPGKSLAMLNRKPVIQWVYENAAKILNEVWVATDDDRIFDTVNAFGGKSIKTRPTHLSGTDRCAEAALQLNKRADFDIVINIQGDEPFIKPAQISKLASVFDKETEIATLIKEVGSEEELFNPNRPKVVVDKDNYALYFSRSTIPFIREKSKENWFSTTKFWIHIGMYAYRKETLQQITKLEPGILEQAEALEQLRWLENGYKIKTAVTDFHNFGIDTPEDLMEAQKILNNSGQKN